jgi:hypothetical protein
LPLLCFNIFIFFGSLALNPVLSASENLSAEIQIAILGQAVGSPAKASSLW